MIFERTVLQKAEARVPVDHTPLLDASSVALRAAQVAAIDAEAARVVAVAERNSAVALATTANAGMVQAITENDLLEQQLEDSESARIAAVSSLEIERASHAATKSILIEERALRTAQEGRLNALVASIAGGTDDGGWEVIVTGRDELGRLLKLRLLKEKP